ncbi:hypothetical protein B0H12DRAFT_230444 [Mycena haematopus]|nr:hypothetical protein B0H12DRAFT_230444 [Mycena haematopus]
MLPSSRRRTTRADFRSPSLQRGPTTDSLSLLADQVSQRTHHRSHHTSSGTRASYVACVWCAPRTLCWAPLQPNSEISSELGNCHFVRRFPQTHQRAHNKRKSQKGTLFVRRNLRLARPGGGFIRTHNLPLLSNVSRNRNSRSHSSALRLPLTITFIVMQCRILFAFVVSLLTLTVTAAPVPDSSDALSREIEHAPFVGISDVAREPEPEPETKTEENRSCRLYTCI